MEDVMRKIFIVNDEKRICRLFSESTIGKDYELICISNESELKKMDKSFIPDMIILASTFEEFNKDEFDLLLSVKTKYQRATSILVVSKLILPQFIPLFDLGIDSIISNYSVDDEIIDEVKKILTTMY
jgi:CheY-like chemotaxis protein